MLTGEMLTGQMLTRVFSYDLILARQIYLDKTGLLGRPEQPFRTGLCFTRDVIFFFATRSPTSVDRSPWNFATWSESGVIL